MTARRLYVPEAQPSRDPNGRALPAKLWFYEPTGTYDTAKTVYTDDTLTVPHPFPVLSNAAGRFPAIWADESELFDVMWSDQVFNRRLDAWSNISPLSDAMIASANAAEVASEAASASADAAATAAATAVSSSATAVAAAAEAIAAAAEAEEIAGFDPTTKVNTDLDNVASADFFAKAVASGVMRDYEAFLGMGYFDRWEEGVNFSSPASGSFAATLFRILYDGSAGTFAIAQHGGPYAVGAPNGLRWNQTVAGSGDTFRMIEGRVEDATTFNNGKATVSVYISAAVTTSATLEVVQSFGTGGSPSTDVVCGSAVQTVTSTATLHTLTVDMPNISSKVFGTDLNDHVKIRVKFPTNATFDITLAELRFERGPNVTPFQQVPLSMKLAYMDRFYQTTRISASGIASAGGQKAFGAIPYRAYMRGPVTGLTATVFDDGRRVNLSGAPTISIKNTFGGSFYITSAASGPFSVDADYVKLDARL